MATTKKWEESQKKAFLYWVNCKLASKGQKIDDLISGFSTGVQFIALVESLTGKTIPPKKWIKNPDLNIHKITNCYIALEFLRECQVKGITASAEDLVNSQVNQLLGLCWILLRHFQSIQILGIDSGSSSTSSEHVQQSSSGLDASESGFEKSLLRWVADVLKNYSDIKLASGYKSEEFHNGKALLALVNEIHPSVLNYESYDPKNKNENCKSAMDFAEKYIGVPNGVLDPDELATGKASDKNLVLYLSLLHNAYKESSSKVQEGTLFSKMKDMEALIRKLLVQKEELLRRKKEADEKLIKTSEESEKIRAEKSSAELEKFNVSSAKNKELQKAKHDIETKIHDILAEIEALKKSHLAVEEQLNALRPENEKFREATQIAEAKNKALTTQFERLMSFLQPVKKVKSPRPDTKVEEQKKAVEEKEIDVENELRKWIELVLNEKLPNGSLRDALKTGTVLCRLVNAIKPNTIKQFTLGQSIHPLKQLENIKAYLGGCWDLGIPGKSMFVPKDIQEPDRFGQVINNLLALNQYAITNFEVPGEIIITEKKKVNVPEVATENIYEEYISFDDVDPSLLDDPSFSGLKEIQIDITALRTKLSEAEKKLIELETKKRQMESSLSSMKDASSAGITINNDFIFGEGNAISAEEAKKLPKDKNDDSIFFLEADLDPNAVKSLNILIRDVLAGKKVTIDFNSVAGHKTVLTYDSGRRLFVYLVKKHLQQREEVIVQDDSFDTMMFLLDQLLGQIEILVGADFLTAQGILDICPKIKKKKIDPTSKKPTFEELTDSIKSHRLWKDFSFWEDYFWQSLLSMSEFKKMEGEGFNSKQQKVIASEIPKFIKKQMWGWGSTDLDTLTKFGIELAKGTGLPQKLIDKIREKIKIVYQFKA